MVEVLLSMMSGWSWLRARSTARARRQANGRTSGGSPTSSLRRHRSAGRHRDRGTQAANPTGLDHLPRHLALFSFAAVADRDDPALLRAITGMVALPSAYLTLAVLSCGGLGMGDIRLAALVGLTLGWRSWTAVAMGTVLALSYAGIAGLVAITLGRLSRHSSLPHGPAMLAGTFTVVLVMP